MAGDSLAGARDGRVARGVMPRVVRRCYDIVALAIQKAVSSKRQDRQLSAVTTFLPMSIRHVPGYVAPVEAVAPVFQVRVYGLDLRGGLH